MKTKTNLAALIGLFTLLINFGCSDDIYDGYINGPNLIDSKKFNAKESFSYTVGLTNHTNLKVEGINGSISIESVSTSNQVVISGEKIVSSNTYMDAYTQLQNVAIKIDELESNLRVKTVQPEFSNGRSYLVNYIIRIPSHLNVDVDNINGEINGKLFVPQNGTVNMQLQNGNIALEIPQNTSSDFLATFENGTISFQKLTLNNRVVTNKSLQGRLGDGQAMITLKITNGNIDVSGF